MTTEAPAAPAEPVAAAAPAETTPPPAAPATPPSLLGDDPASTPPPAEDGTTTQTDKKDEPPAPAVPEKYEFTLPEGVVLDEALAAKFTPLAQKFKLTQENANELVGFYAEARQADAKAQADAWTKHLEGWRESVRTDPEMGGQNYDQTLSFAMSAVARFGSDAMKQNMKLYGYGNDPEMVRFCAAIGKAMGEDSIRSGKGPGEDGVKSARDFYDNSAMN